MTTLDQLAADAIARHSHYYTDAAGWLLRADTQRYSYVVDADREEYGVSDPRVEVRAYPVVRWTPCGATIRDIWGRGGTDTRFCDLRDGRKQYASRDIHEALCQLVERRRRQLWVLARKTARAEEDIQCARVLINSACNP
jgi:hypothetical protein